MGELKENEKKKKPTAMLLLWHLALVFIHAKSSFLFMEHNQAKHHVISTVQGRASSCWSCSVICPSTGHPREPGKLLLPRMVAEHTGASSEGLSWCCSFIFTCGKQGGHMLACPFLLTFLLSLLPVSPAPSLVLYHCLLSTEILAHSYVWHFFFLTSCLRFSYTGSFKKQQQQKSAICLFQRCQFW